MIEEVMMVIRIIAAALLLAVFHVLIFFELFCRALKFGCLIFCALFQILMHSRTRESSGSITQP